MIIKKSILYTVLTLVLIVLAGFFFLKSGSGNSDNEVINNYRIGEVQNIVLSYKDYNYYPNTIRANAGQTVRISLDSSVYGCFRSFTIPAFKISKNLRTPSDYVEFTPTKPGTYRFACSMGMGTGTLIVE